jgi:hypothetical protein
MPSRFIVRFRGSAPAKEIVSRLRDSPAIEVLEDTPRMVLVEGDEEDLRNLVPSGPDVLVIPERHYEVPDQRPSIKRDRSRG